MAASFPPDNVANFHETATVAGYVYALGQQFSPPYQFHDHVGSRTVGKLPQPADSGLGGIELLDVDSVVGPELLSQLQAVLRTAQDNDPVGPHVLGHGGEVRVKASGPLMTTYCPSWAPARIRTVVTVPMAQLTGPSRSLGNSSGTRKKG